MVQIRDVLLVTLPPDPDDTTIISLQESVLGNFQRAATKALLLDLSAVEIFDSFFARTVSETASMCALMGGRTILTGMRPSVAITATQLGLALHKVETALDVDRALDRLLPDERRGGGG